jgi:hypothetical protein
MATSDGSSSAVAADPGRHILARFESELDDQTGECSNVRAARFFLSEAPRITGLGRVTGGDDEAAASDTHQLGFMHIFSHDAENERVGAVATYTLLGSVEDDGVGACVLCVADLARNAFRAVSAFEFHHLGGLRACALSTGLWPHFSGRARRARRACLWRIAGGQKEF